MTTLEQIAAADIIADAVEEGTSGTDIAERAKSSAQELRTMQEQFFSQFNLTLSASGQESFDVSAVVQNVEETAGKIGEIVGAARTDELEGNIAGYAYQGQEGSSVIDVSAAFQPQSTTIIDVHMLQDIVKHEHEHELQASQWNAQIVDIGNGRTLDRETVSEVGAMSVQESIAWVSDDYKHKVQYVTNLGITMEQARKAAQAGDLIGLGAKIQEKFSSGATIPESSLRSSNAR